MSKKLPAWIVLTVISLVAALALGATYNGTKDRIATQEAEKAVAVRQELLPEAVDFALLTAEDETDVYQGLDASGASVGYVSVGTVTGFGGPVEVTVGMDDEGTIAGVRVGGSNFSETAGLGAKSKEPAFYEQFAGMAYPVDLVKNGGEVDAITAATITSSAVVRGVNETAKYIAEKAGIKLKEPVVLVTELGNNRYATTKQGFGGPIYVEAEVVDGVITDIAIGDDSYAESRPGAKEESFYSQFLGKGGTNLALGADIDAYSGATISSTAVTDAVNLILLYVNDPAGYQAMLADTPEETDVSIPAGAETWTAQGKGLTGTFDVTISVDENAAVTGIAVGDASTAEDSAFLGQVKNNSTFLAQFIGTQGNVDASAIDLVSGATISSKGVVSAVNAAWNESQGIAEATPAPTAEPTGDEYKTKAQGLTGAFPVWVYVDNGEVTGVKIGETESEYDEPYLALVKDNSTFLGQFAGKTAKIAESEIDTVSGATLSSKGVLGAVNEAISKLAPAAAATPAPAADIAGTEYKAKGQGLTGAFPVTVILDDNGAVAAVRIGDSESEYDGEYLAKVKDNADFLNQFIGKNAEVTSIDAVAGATISSKAVQEIVNKAIASFTPAAAAPAEEVTGTEYTAKGQGLTGAFPVTVILDDNGAVAAVKVGDSESEYDGTYLALVKDNASFLNQFLGKDAEVTAIDAVAGATISSKAVQGIVNKAIASFAPAAAAPAEKVTGTEYSVKGQGLTGAFPITVILDDNSAVAGVKIGDSESEYDGTYLALVKDNAFLSQFVGKTGAADSIDLVSGATISSKSVVEAVNKVLAENAPAAEAPAEEPAADIAGAEYTAKGQGLTGAFPVTVVLDENAAVAAVKIGDSESEYDGTYLAMVRDNAAFLNQFIGLTAPVEKIDAVTGATISSKAVQGVVNEALASAPAAAPAEEPTEAAAAPAPLTDGVYAETAKGMVDDVNVNVTIENGAVAQVEVAKSDSATDALYVDMVRENEAFLAQFIGKTDLIAEGDYDVVTGATFSSNAVAGCVNQAVNKASAPAAEEAAEAPATLAGEYTVAAPSFTDDLSVTVTLDESGAITDIRLADSEDAGNAPYVEKARNEAFLAQFIGRKAPVEDFDVIAGATFSSKAVAAAVNDLFAQLGIEAEKAAPAAAETKEAAAYKDGSYEAQVENLTVTVTVAGGKVTDVAVKSEPAEADALYVAMVENNAAFLSQFAGQSAPVEADAVTGATFTSENVTQAVNQALESAK